MPCLRVSSVNPAGGTRTHMPLQGRPVPNGLRLPFPPRREWLGSGAVSSLCSNPPPPLPVEHPIDSPKLESSFRPRCAGFVHPHTGVPNEQWCVDRQKDHREVFLGWYLGKRDPGLLKAYRDCLLKSGGVPNGNGRIRDETVQWDEAVDCTDQVDRKLGVQ